MHIVTKAHKSTYTDPIILKPGDQFRLFGKTDNLDGHTWLWAEAIDGKQGWVPDTLPKFHNGLTTAQYDYSAFELNSVLSEGIEVKETRNGWAWCRNQDGLAGWVPMENLIPC